jgi:hypothetical protein
MFISFAVAACLFVFSNKVALSERSLIKFDMAKASGLMYRPNSILACVGQLRLPHETILDLKEG